MNGSSSSEQKLNCVARILSSKGEGRKEGKGLLREDSDVLFLKDGRIGGREGSKAHGVESRKRT